MIGLYFSGTGNTKHCVTLYVKEMSEHGISISMEDPNWKTYIQTFNQIVLGYPIYYSSLPKIMEDMIKENALLWKGKDIFIITTMGLFSGDGCGCAARLLRAYGANIIGGLHIKMPDCISDEKLLKHTDETNRKTILSAEQKIKEAAQQHKQGNPYQQGLSFPSHLLGLFGQRLWFHHKVKHYVDDLKINHDACIACGTCVSLCPMQNLSLVNSQLITHHQCTMCYRCINHCPTKALTLLGKEVIAQYRLKQLLEKQNQD